MPLLSCVCVSVCVVVGLTGLTACTRVGGAPGPEDDSDLVVLNVINHYQATVAVFEVSNGHRNRLGDVSVEATRMFPLHLRRLVGGEMQFYADPVGSPRGVTSELLHVAEGETVDWTLESSLARSHVAIR